MGKEDTMIQSNAVKGGIKKIKGKESIKELEKRILKKKETDLKSQENKGDDDHKTSTEMSKRKKKRQKSKENKKRKHQEVVTSNDASTSKQDMVTSVDTTTTTTKLSKKQQKIKKMFDDLGITDIIKKKQQKMMKSSQLKESSKNGQKGTEGHSNIPVVKFESRKRKSQKFASSSMRTKDVVIQKDDHTSPDDEELRYKFDMKKARHEVFKYGLNAMDPETKYSTKIAHAVSLGAKPPKNEYKNYKDVILERKQQKEKEQMEKSYVCVDRYQIQSSLTPSKKKKEPKKKEKFDPLVGKYKDGIQFIKKKDIRVK